MDNPFAHDYVAPPPADDVTEVSAPAKTKGVSAGVHRLDAAAYHADPAPLPSLSATLAKTITAKSPLHAWSACRRLNRDFVPVERKTFDIGTAAHRAVLGSGGDYIAIPSDILAANGAASTAAAKAFIADARDRGLTPIKEDEVDQIERMADVARARLSDHGICLDPERSELSAFAEIDGAWCRAMFDNVPADPALPIYDHKTCEDARPEACLKAILNYGYDVQAEHYLSVWKAATGEDRPFVFIFQEKPAPNEVTLIRLSGSFRDLAQRRATRARRIWAECVSTNNWPGYPAGIHEVDAPAWLIEREYQEEI